MDEWMIERYELAKMRVSQIPGEQAVAQPYLDFFQKAADFLIKTIQIMDDTGDGLSFEALKERNQMLYQDISGDNYNVSYGNPSYAKKMLGEYGRDFTFLYGELRGTIVYAHEKDLWEMTVALELFLEVYSAFDQEEIPEEKVVRKILYSYVNDYCQDMMEHHVRSSLDPEMDFAVKIIMEADLSDLSYLYRFGEYISENELGSARFLNTLPQEEIDAMARTYTEGYRIGFINGRKEKFSHNL